MSDSKTIDQQFIEYVVTSLVSKPEAVKVERTIDEKGVLLTLTVDPEDLGRVIGKRGATAQSLRTLLRALGTKQEARYNLKIVDNGEPRPDRRNNEHDNSGGEAWASAPSGSNDEALEAEAPNQDTTETVSDDTDQSSPEAVSDFADDNSEAIRKTRKELEDLDDLDI